MKAVSELEGAELDFWVAMAEGRDIRISYGCQIFDYIDNSWQPFNPSDNWGLVGPLIEKWWIELRIIEVGYGWEAEPSKAGRYPNGGGIWLRPTEAEGRTALEAACRAIIASVYGEYVSEEE